MASQKVSKSEAVVCFCRFSQVVTLWGLIFFLIWICLTPKSPVFIITNAQISALHRRYSSEFTRNTTLILNLEISNPNKGIQIQYDDISIILYHNNSVVGNNSLPGFHQGYRNSTRNKVQVNPRKQFWREITGEIMGIRVCLQTAVKFQYKIFGTKTKLRPMDFEAYMPIGNSGRILGNMIMILQHNPNDKIKE